MFVGTTFPAFALQVTPSCWNPKHLPLIQVRCKADAERLKNTLSKSEKKKKTPGRSGF